MYDYLVDHAIKNVWCTPDQDLQAIVKPARLTPINGTWNTVRVLWRNYDLPVRGPRFHVYQIGQLHPMLMGLFETNGEWVSFAKVCGEENLIVDVYAETGVQMPRSEVWFMVTPDRNLIVAVKQQPLIPIDFNNDALFIRVYSNAYFNSDRSDPLNDYIEVNGGTMATAADIIALQNKYELARSLPGAAYAFVNGYRVSAINLFTAKAGDVVEYVYDSSIYKVVDFPIAELPTFTSELDSNHKYLLHFADNANTGIDYCDDVDVFIHNAASGAASRGVFYSRNRVDAMRMVTHRDYSVPVAYVVGYVNDQTDWGDPSLCSIRLHIRKSGYLRPLANEDNRILELYKLSDDDVVAAMVGIDATVSNWTASNLENSGYTKIMRSQSKDITPDLVRLAYGYNAISKLLADTPKATAIVDGQNSVSVNYGMMDFASAYEYDSEGLLLGHYSHEQGSHYNAYHPATALIEMLAGFQGPSPDDVYGQSVTPLDPKADYRFYTCSIVGGVPSNNWVDVTGGGDYLVSNNKVTWLIDPDSYYTLVRSNRTILAYDFDSSANDGLLSFSLTHRSLRGGVSSTWVMQVPMGELDIFLNGHSLIEGLDYFVVFPKVVITNKKYLVNPLTDQQKISVRFSGFCNADMSRTLPTDRGFVDHGFLSSNNEFDIRDDKVTRITVDGKLYLKSELHFSEENSGVAVPGVENGAPYQIRDIVVPLDGHTTDTTYPMRAHSQIIDKRISDYMTLKKPEVDFPTPNAITERYPVISPFTCKIIYDLWNGILQDSRLYADYGDNAIDSILANYLYLLDFDPSQAALESDSNYVIVHLHNLDTVIDLDIYQYRFVTRVVKLYLNNKADVSHFIRLAPAAQPT